LAYLISLLPVAWYAAISFSYFSFSLAAFCSYGCLSLADCSEDISPSFFTVSLIDRPGCSLLIFGRCSKQNRKKADGSLFRVFGFFFFKEKDFIKLTILGYSQSLLESQGSGDSKELSMFKRE
jgi:hypothetical protein